MKKLLPLVLALLGLGAGMGAGVVLKPEPAETAIAEACAQPDAAQAAEANEGHGEAQAAEAEPCEPAPADPFAKAEPEAGHGIEGDVAYVPLDKPFVVPVFRGGKIAAMVVVSLSVAVGHEAEATVETVQPRLRDSFLKVMFQHANSGGFDGSFTSGQKMADLHAALLAAARAVVKSGIVGEVLITEIARQDV